MLLYCAGGSHAMFFSAVLIAVDRLLACLAFPALLGWRMPAARTVVLALIRDSARGAQTSPLPRLHVSCLFIVKRTEPPDGAFAGWHRALALLYCRVGRGLPLTRIWCRWTSRFERGPGASVTVITLPLPCSSPVVGLVRRLLT